MTEKFMMSPFFALGMEAELFIALQKAIKAGVDSPDSRTSRLFLPRSTRVTPKIL